MSDIFDWKGPITELVLNKVKSGVTDMVVSYIEGLPIMLGVSIGVYALLSMISKTFAKLGVVFVFAYGAVIVVA